MSPAAATEDRLRRDLDALAPDPPPDLLALAAVSRAVGRRRRRRRGVALAAGTALVAAALVGPALVERERGSDVITPASDRTPAPTTAAPPAPLSTTEGTAVVPPTTAAPPAAGAAAADPGPAAGERVTFANVSLALPERWAVAERDGDRSMCIAPAGNPAPRWDGCAGLMLNHGDLPGFEDRPYEAHGDWAWYHHTDVNPCPTAPDPKPGDPLDGVVGDGPRANPYDPVESGLRKVGSHGADYDRWAARCQLSGFTFRPRAWHLPASQIVIFDVLERPETDQILASFQFTSHM